LRASHCAGLWNAEQAGRPGRITADTANPRTGRAGPGPAQPDATEKEFTAGPVFRNSREAARRAREARSVQRGGNRAPPFDESISDDATEGLQRIPREVIISIFVLNSPGSAPVGEHSMEGKTSKPRILIVDDDPDNISILREILKEYTVLAATSGQSAISLAAANPPPDLILLDIKMPNMDGFDVLKTLKTSQRTRNIKIVFVTAKRTIDDKMTAYQKGIEDYITKPIDPQFVIQIVQRLTSEKR
jgi:CheY-like chemotaxis protein